MRVFAYGRLHHLHSRTWDRALETHGGRRVRRIRDADHIVFGLGAATRSEEQLRAELGEVQAQGQAVLSERGFLRRLGLISGVPDEARPFSAADLAQRSKLSVDLIAL